MEDRRLLGGRGPHYFAQAPSAPKLLHVAARLPAFHLLNHFYIHTQKCARLQGFRNQLTLGL